MNEISYIGFLLWSADHPFNFGNNSVERALLWEFSLLYHTNVYEVMHKIKLQKLFFLLWLSVPVRNVGIQLE